MQPWNLLTLSLADLSDRPRPEVAVIPLGAIEPHNYHLPYGNDFLTASRVAELACERATAEGASVVLLPGCPYGVDKNLLKFPLVVHVSIFTLNALLTDIIRSLERHQIHKLVLLNGHGGNTLKPLLREWYSETPVFVSLIDWWKVGADVYEQIFACADDHAGEMETSVALALYPELVKMERAVWEPPKQPVLKGVREGWVQVTRPWHGVTTTSGTADPRQATPEKGKKYLEVVVERIASYLVELARSPLHEAFPFPCPQ